MGAGSRCLIRRRTGCSSWYRDGLASLVDTLDEAPADVPAWTFFAAPSPKAFWTRRQAHETAMHRADVEIAGGATIRYPVDFAVDGIDELLGGFLTRPRTQAVRRSAAAPADHADRFRHLVAHDDRP